MPFLHAYMFYEHSKLLQDAIFGHFLSVKQSRLHNFLPCGSLKETEVVETVLLDAQSSGTVFATLHSQYVLKYGHEITGRQERYLLFPT